MLFINPNKFILYFQMSHGTRGTTSTAFSDLVGPAGNLPVTDLGTKRNQNKKKMKKKNYQKTLTNCFIFCSVSVRSRPAQNTNVRR